MGKAVQIASNTLATERRKLQGRHEEFEEEKVAKPTKRIHLTKSEARKEKPLFLSSFTWKDRLISGALLFLISAVVIYWTWVFADML
uniref:Uncharacterized protein n=1 Tax=Tetraselmis sp. GSL018 TaxID=582737 RepID=A0A061R4P5_9CHLO|mmetsp:Transcript_3524/g.8390  ORF Transcript_3524/g.8390 Transcript_3524/m.8390 type:complete len:87 (-) Transcript_3524:26-286(-)